MRVRIIAVAVLMSAVIGVSTGTGVAQNASGATHHLARPELALGYSYLRSNAPPGGCTCFNLNGGNATFAWPFKAGRFALAGDITAAHSGGISSDGYSLTLVAYTFGARYRPQLGHSPLQPFGQVLVGVAHAGGTLVHGQTASIPNAGATFAANLGGGLDLSISRHFSWRAIEADYLLTTFDNGSNNHQNNLRIGTGVVFHF